MAAHTLPVAWTRPAGSTQVRVQGRTDVGTAGVGAAGVDIPEAGAAAVGSAGEGIVGVGIPGVGAVAVDIPGVNAAAVGTAREGTVGVGGAGQAAVGMRAAVLQGLRTAAVVVLLLFGAHRTATGTWTACLLQGGIAGRLMMMGVRTAVDAAGLPLEQGTLGGQNRRGIRDVSDI